MPPPCPLCANNNPSRREHANGRQFWQCARCGLVFVSPSQRPSRTAEIERYRQHRNCDDDAGYLAFLSRLADVMIQRTPAGARGLDFGSGTSTALARLLSNQGRQTDSYDPVFHAVDAALSTTYDFVTCSEVLEHVHEPRAFLDRVGRLLRPGASSES